MARVPTPADNTLVTGANGFAGSHLVDRLIGREPLVGWHRPSARVPERGPGIRWQAVDVTDRRAVRAALEDIRPARIYHLAGAARVDASWGSVVPHLEANALGTHHLLTAVRDLGHPCRVLVVTSAMIYQFGEAPVTEEAPLIPASPYGLSKLAQDQLALRAASEDDLDVVVARPFNHTGPRQAPEFAIAGFARQIARIEAGQAPPEIEVGNLDAARDLSDVRDIVDAYVTLMAGGVRGRPYNVCSGHAVRIGDALDALVGMASVTVSVVVDPARLRPSDTPIVLGSADRLGRELGWRPRIPLSQTLRDTLDWWRERQHS